jgi:sulfur-oxidizing protein SoxZ
MADATRLRATVKDGKVDVRMLMSHEMESGQRKDSRGAIVPAWFIQNVVAMHGGRVVLSAQWGPSISKNPFLNFRFSGGKLGDKLSVTWTDNRGDKRSDETTITAE